jgi:tRNA threonylcarbamoyladenosine biosynthesis protein TsaB
MSAPNAAGRWLAFDTSTDVLSLGVARGDRVWTQTLPGGAQSSSGLIPAVLAMLAEAEMPLATLDAIVFGRGPGSFTGLRTACAVAQGLAFGADVPVLPIDTLLAVAEEARWAQHQAGLWAPGESLSVLALLDARMDEVYSAAYRWSAELGDVQSGLPGALLGRWHNIAALQVSPPERVQAPMGPGALLAGNAFAAYGERLPAGPRCVAMPTAAALLRLAPAAWAQGQAVPAEQAVPLYIRDKVANTTAEREAMKLQAQAAQSLATGQP